MYFVSFLAFHILCPSKHLENVFCGLLSSFALSLNPSKVKECASLSRFSSNVLSLICHPLMKFSDVLFELSIVDIIFIFLVQRLNILVIDHAHPDMKSL